MGISHAREPGRKARPMRVAEKLPESKSANCDVGLWFVARSEGELVLGSVPRTGDDTRYQQGRAHEGAACSLRITGWSGCGDTRRQ